MKRRKGFIALLLSVVMVMSLFSGVAFASESTTPTQTQATGTARRAGAVPNAVGRTASCGGGG